MIPPGHRESLGFTELLLLFPIGGGLSCHHPLTPNSQKYTTSWEKAGWGIFRPMPERKKRKGGK
jgi:hypothetical protein